jgi:hypothetical protein
MDMEAVALRPSLLKILAPGSEQVNGTGFVVQRDGYALTCYHVIKPYIDRNETEVRVVFAGDPGTPQLYMALLQDRLHCPDGDIAVLKLQGLPDFATPLTLDVHERWKWKPDADLYSFGFPQIVARSAGLT